MPAKEWYVCRLRCTKRISVCKGLTLVPDSRICRCPVDWMRLKGSRAKRICFFEEVLQILCNGMDFNVHNYSHFYTKQVDSVKNKRWLSIVWIRFAFCSRINQKANKPCQKNFSGSCPTSFVGLNRALVYYFLQ